MGDEANSGRAGGDDSGEVRAWLVEVRSGKAFPLPDKQEITVGRVDQRKEIYPDVDLTPVDPCRTVSRRHASIIREPGDGFSVIDSSRSLNGIYLNGERVVANQPSALKAGDSLIFGTIWCRFRQESVTDLYTGGDVFTGAGVDEAPPDASEPPSSDRKTQFAFGMNENLQASGRDFHVQTEDLGWDQESILSVVYSAGAIVFSRKTPYEFFQKRRGKEIKPTEMVRFQHRSIVAGIQSGKYLAQAG